jgi:hypothetical protein
MAAMISSRRAETGRDSGNSIFKGVEDKGETSVKINGLGFVRGSGSAKRSERQPLIIRSRLTVDLHDLCF